MSKSNTEFIIIDDVPVSYVNLTGGSIANILACIKLSCIKTTYLDYQFKLPRECEKRIYPVSERFQCITNRNETDFTVLQYSGFYHVKIEGYVLKIYDYNVGKPKETFQILLNDEEYTALLPARNQLRPTINNNPGLP